MYEGIQIFVQIPYVSAHFYNNHPPFFMKCSKVVTVGKIFSYIRIYQ
jgi:hypothetical protein